jgi:DNA polymerase III, gamma/tau subunits
MLQAHIFLTQTYTDQSKLKKLITKACLQNPTTIVNNLTSFLEDPNLDSFWNQQLVKGTVLEPNLDTKKEFTDSLLEFYVRYTKPTLLFLGNLDSFSLPMQEGMLKFLEEPPQNLIIILFAQERVNILPTISSRCQLHRLPNQLVLGLLDQKLLEQTKNKLPAADSACKHLVLHKPLSLPDLKNVEREEIDFWLWQVQVYLENFYKHQPHWNYLHQLAKVIQARQLNQQNLQKKFVLAWLNT